MKNRTSPGRNRMNVHHRRAHPDSGHQGIETALIFSVEMSDIGRCAPHIETDDLVVAAHCRGLYHADHPPGRTGEDRILALEEMSISQTTVRLHKHQPWSIAQLLGYLVNVAPQNRRKVSIDNRGITARHQLHQRADPTAE